MRNNNNTAKKPRTQACVLCHQTKNKCVYTDQVDANGRRRCERCIRLNKECIPHISRQGKRTRPSLDLGSNTTASNVKSVMSHNNGMNNNVVAPVISSGFTNNHNQGQAGLGNNNNLNLNMMSSSGVNQGQQGINNYNMQEQLTQTNESLQLLLNQLGSNPGGGDIDPAQLNLVLNSFSANPPLVGNNNLLNNSFQNQNTINSGGDSSSFNNNMAMGSNTQAALLMNLAGSSMGNTSGSMLQNNNFDSSSTTNQGLISKINSLMGAFNPIAQSQTNHQHSRTNSLGGAQSYTSSNQDLGRRSTIDLNPTSQAMISNTVSESLLKKQKKAHLLQQPPEYLQYPQISLLPSQNRQSSSESNNTSNNDVKGGGCSSAQENTKCSTCHDTDVHSKMASMSRENSAVAFYTPEDTIGSQIAKAISKNSGKNLTCLKHHYGLQCQIREWISMALTRRSFALLSKASSLANRCGIHMDRILCGLVESSPSSPKDKKEDTHNNDYCGKRMSYLLATLLEPRSQQSLPVNERFMLQPNLPPEFLSIVGCAHCPSFQPDQIGNLWIIIRQTYKGVTSFYCSPAFERNVLCWTHISQIYEDNLADINSLIFVNEDFRKFLACNAHQISTNSSPGMSLKPVHCPKTKIRLLGRQWGQASYTDPGLSGYITKEMIRNVTDSANVKTLEMDLRFLSFPTMDKMTYYLEFFHHSEDGNSSAKSGSSANWTRNLSNDSLNKGAAGDQQVGYSIDADTKPSAADDRVVSHSPAREEPPPFDDVMDCEEWVGISDVLASGDIDNLLTALLD